MRAVLLSLLVSGTASAFCGFYVAGADECRSLDVTSCAATDGCAPRFGPNRSTCADHVCKECERTR